MLQSTWSAMDRYLKTLSRSIHWQEELAPDERAFLEFFFLLVYTPRAHNSGMVPAEWNARVDEFWREAERRRAQTPRS